MEEKELNSTESLLSMIVERTFSKHNIDTTSIALTTDERRKLMETVRILQNQAETFLKRPVVKKSSGTAKGAQKFTPNNLKD
ncbi:MAG: hypothetical protein K0R71_344 [Bacillales bacterium]|jgi:Trp operon repressor|nr:hypothetical protein [Bacillales bacterium]